ncbi:hypothetical protein GCM10018952_13770 [Streptosporangium vulgare]
MRLDGGLEQAGAGQFLDLVDLVGAEAVLGGDRLRVAEQLLGERGGRMRRAARDRGRVETRSLVPPMGRGSVGRSGFHAIKLRIRRSPNHRLAGVFQARRETKDPVPDG